MGGTKPSADHCEPDGEALRLDLGSCDREPIHQLGAIQANGFLFAASMDWSIRRISANVPHWIGRPAAELLGLSLERLFSAKAAHTIRNRLMVLRNENSIERTFGLQLLEAGPLFDIAVHLSGDGFILECEPSRGIGHSNATALVRGMIGRLYDTTGSSELCREAARQLKALAGFDRVMVYRFRPDGSGEVVGEAVRIGLEPFLGLRYPASDIPQQARALYERNWLRLITDVDSEPVPILPLHDPDGVPLDLSMSMLRSVSPIHLEYLRNMGVRASMSVSILVHGKLWGLFACHHLSPRPVDFEHRAAAELFGQIFSLMLDSRERDLDVEYEAYAFQLQNQIKTMVAPGSTALDNISSLAHDLTNLIPCDGIAIWIDGKASFSRCTTTCEEFRGLLDFLNDRPVNGVYAIHELGLVHPPARAYAERVAGLLAIPLSREPGDYILFFRREVAHSVAWAGNPHKPVTVGPNGARLSPRASFAVWNEMVRGQSSVWAATELRVAELLRITLLEIVLRLTGIADRERGRAAERQELLIAELNHRIRNILGLVHGLVAQSQSGAQSVEAFASILGGRVQALARAHDQITAQHWGPGALRALIVAETAAYLTTPTEDRVRCSGPDVLLQPVAFSTLALVMHELMTNSAKYGALSAVRGHVDIAWSLDPTGGLVIDWAEQGGPPVSVPTRRGFGTTIIERMIPHDLKGEAEIRYHPAGLHAQLTIPLQFVTTGAVSLPEPDATPLTMAKPLSGDVLLVEDNIIIALDAEDMLRRLGATHVDIAGNVDEALRLIEANRPSFAVLDINLGNETSFEFASQLQTLGISYCFATGYGEGVSLPPEHSNISVAKKPYSILTLAKAVSEMP